MELDSLKTLWQDLDANTSHADSDEHILSMLRKRSQSPIAKMRRNLLWELIALVVLYSATIWYYVSAWGGRYWEIGGLLFLVGAFCLFYYYRKNKLLSDMQCVVCEVKSNLQRQLVTLEKYVNFYFIAGTLLTPLVYFASGLIVFFKTPQARSISPDLRSQLSDSTVNLIPHIVNHRFFTAFVVIGVVLAIGSYFLNRWYVNKLYGQHIEKLKDLLGQMEEVD
jgi:hypothetical protein